MVELRLEKPAVGARLKRCDAVQQGSIETRGCVLGEVIDVAGAVDRSALGKQVQADAQVGARTQFQNGLAAHRMVAAGVLPEVHQPFVDHLQVIGNASIRVFETEGSRVRIAAEEVLGLGEARKITPAMYNETSRTACRRRLCCLLLWARRSGVMPNRAGRAFCHSFKDFHGRFGDGVPIVAAAGFNQLFADGRAFFRGDCRKLAQTWVSVAVSPTGK